MVTVTRFWYTGGKALFVAKKGCVHARSTSFVRLFILSALIIIATFAAGFLAGHLRANGPGAAR
jgi:hypothetical protein